MFFLRKIHYNFFTHNGKIKKKLNVIKFAKKVEDLGAGEIVLNSIDKDGLMSGYNVDLIDHKNELYSSSSWMQVRSITLVKFKI